MRDPASPTTPVLKVKSSKNDELLEAEIKRLYEFIRNGKEHEVAQILKRNDLKSYLELKNSYTGYTPLHLAANMGKEKIVRLLLDTGLLDSIYFYF